MVERADVQAALEARKELGPEYESQIVDAMLERIEKRLDEHRRDRPLPARREHQGAVTPLVLGSIGLGIPVTAVALSNAPGAGGIAVAMSRGSRSAPRTSPPSSSASAASGARPGARHRHVSVTGMRR